MGICVSCRRRERKAPLKRTGAGSGFKGAAAAHARLLQGSANRDELAAMANSISNIKMTNPLKGMVSKRRKRYIKDGFNLDLAYITDKLIAMGFPAEKLEGVYRNHIDEVYRFLEQKHKDHYKIYNLCSERSYDSSKFHERVSVYPFDDHAPPKLEMIQPFCEDVHKWLSADSKNVAAVHCKAGKGRTGTMLCCYLLYSGQKLSAEEAMNYYGATRTHDEKGVTIPSQRRYVEYYAALVRSRLQYSPCSVHIRELVLSPPPMLNGGQCTLEFCVLQANVPVKISSGCHEVRKHETVIRIPLNHCTLLAGDVRVELYNKPKMMMRKEKLFHFWFNTFFITQEVGAIRVPSPDDSPDVETFKLCLNKWQLDDAHKDRQHKLYSSDFKVELIIQKPPETSTWSGRQALGEARRTTSPQISSSESSSEDEPEDEHWDSGEPPNHETAVPSAETKQAKCLFNTLKRDSDTSNTSKESDDLKFVSPQNYSYDYAFTIGPFTRSVLETGSDSSNHSSTLTTITDVSHNYKEDNTSNEGKIPKVSSDHTISSTDSDRYPSFEPSRICKSPTEQKHKKYVFFSNSKKSPDSSESGKCESKWSSVDISKPRLSLGDMRASWREFSGRRFGTEQSKQKKKQENSQSESKNDL